MTTLVRFLLLLVLLPALSTPVQAQDQTPRLEVSLDPQGPVTVGLPLTVTLTLLVPTYMPQPPVWPDMQIADAVTRAAPGSSRAVSREIGGETWAGIVRSFTLLPQRAADYAFPPTTVRVTYADPASNAPVTQDLPLPDITFTAVIPEGAAGLDPFVAARTLTLTATVTGPGDAPKPGAAVELVLVTEAQGTAAMLLPPLMTGAQVPEGLRAYPRQPVLEDVPGQRGAPDTARRTESISYVVQEPGDYRLEGVRLDWWNAQTGHVETATTDPVVFSVPTPPGWHPPLTPEEEAARRHRNWALAAGAIAAVMLLWALRKRIAAGWSGWRARRAVSEPVLYRHLRRHIRHGDAGAIGPALNLWLQSLRTVRAPQELESAMIGFDRTVWGPSPTGSETGRARRNLLHTLHSVRTRLKATAPPPQDDQLPPLNPFWNRVG